jgi:simple sugar transport system ATP-binding protein
MVQLQGIEKYFPSNGVKALRGADFDLEAGEIHALLGENGAGKSTLMHIMAGFIKPGKGRIALDHREVHFASPAHALAAGIGMVRQHPHLVPGFSVWENCVLGSTLHSGPGINRRALRRKAALLNERWNFGLPLDSSAECLTVSQTQKTAILGLLLRDVRFLVFDEPTAVLAPDETGKLFGLFKELMEEGKGIVLISHKLEETLKLAGRVTILRKGKTRAALAADGLDGKKLRDLIFGEKPETPVRNEGDASTESGIPALELEHFIVNVPGRPIIRGINLTLKRGKILGIAGVRDSGLETLELAVAGYIPSSGSMRINGIPQTERSIKNFRNSGGAYLEAAPETSARSQLLIRDMLIIHAHRRLQKGGFLDRRELEKWVEAIMKKARVPQIAKSPAGSLSGGQLQRILLMREYAENAPLMVLAEPGRGIDDRYWKRFRRLISERARAGTGVLLFSADTESLLSISDEVMVLRDGFISGAIDLNGPGSDSGSSDGFREQLRRAMVGEV